MELLFALLQKGAALIKKLLAFISKEFFFIFLYGVISSVLTLLLWLLLKYAFVNKDIYTHLLTELNGSEKLVLVFLFGLSLCCVYLYRLLLAAVQSAVLK